MQSKECSLPSANTHDARGFLTVSPNMQDGPSCRAERSQRVEQSGYSLPYLSKLPVEGNSGVSFCTHR